MRILITGGAGFIGSYLAKRLVKNHDVTVIDHLSSGKKDNIKDLMSNNNFKFIEADLLHYDNITGHFAGIDVVFHLAALADVREQDVEKHMNHNLLATKHVLEAMKEKNVKKIIFSSTSTVYGEPEGPAREDHPCKPISIYGATKLAAELLIKSYSKNHDINYTIFRFANIIGKEGSGVVIDFINKLRENPKELEILGDGNQNKSYLFIEDCIEAILGNWEKDNEIFNIGSEDQLTVKKIAEIVSEEMGLDNVNFIYRDRFNGRGWPGDVKNYLLDISKIKKHGWTPKHNSEDSIRKTVRLLLEEN